MPGKRRARAAAVVLAACLLSSQAFAEEKKGSEEAFGGPAWEALEYLENAFPGRNTGSEAERACGEWLKEELESFGYAAEEQEFSVPDGRTGKNLWALKKGEVEKEILLCAHYDSDRATNGADDNGSGVSVVLETAGRLAKTSVPCSVRMIFFSGEEEGIYGSQAYVNRLTQEEEDRILCVINLDSIAAGDCRYVHGGTPGEGGTVAGRWLQEHALRISEECGLGMTVHGGLPGILPGTRVQGSDQMFFAYRGIPYLYLEASLYSESRGNEKPYRVQTADGRVERGQIMHSPYDSLKEIERLFPQRARGHLAAYSRLVWELCTRLRPDGTLAEPREAEETAELWTETASVAETEETRQGETVLETTAAPLETGGEENKKSTGGWAGWTAAVLLAAAAGILWRRKR